MLSLSARAVWIEIWYQLLWYHYMRSLSARAVWIEIITTQPYTFIDLRHCLRGQCVVFCYVTKSNWVNIIGRAFALPKVTTASANSLSTTKHNVVKNSICINFSTYQVKVESIIKCGNFWAYGAVAWNIMNNAGEEKIIRLLYVIMA